MTSPTILKRADVPVEQTWNRESVFATWDEFQAEYDAIAAKIPELEQFKGKLGESPEQLLQFFDLSFALRRRVGRLYNYVGLSTAVDTSDDVAKSQSGQVTGLFGRMASTMAYAEPEMLEIGETLLEWAEQNADLAIYKHYFDDLLRQAKYTQSPEVERLLGMVQDAFSGPSNTYGELANTDLKFPDAVDSEGNKHRVAQDIVPPTGIKSTDRALRRDAWQKFCDAHKAVENTMASNLIASVKQNVFMARARGYNSVLEAQLMPAKLPLEVFHNLIDTFKANISVWHRYWEAKRKALGVESIQPYDIWAPLTDNPPNITYQTAIDWITAGLEPLGDEYVAILRRGATTDRWVDYAQNEGRMQGAFSSAVYDCHPFIFNTFDGSLQAMSVLAHELGHSMHGYWMDKHQPEVYNGYFANGASSSVAETASNFHQAMVRAYLINQNTEDKDFQLALIDEAMFNFHRYFFIMPTLAQFEYEVYTKVENNQPVNAGMLNEIMSRLYADGYGNTMTDDSERTATTWMQFAHLYSPYYTFQYSVGISAAHAFAGNILDGKDNASQRYLDFIGAGWSAYAPDLFAIGGVDMTKPEPVEQTFAVLETLVKRLESLV